MKKCNNCGAPIDDNESFCTLCKFSNPEATQLTNEQITEQNSSVGVAVEEIPVDPNGNIVAGIVGAFLFSAIGGVIYFLIYQLGYIAALSGLITFVLANLGYSLFARVKNKTSMVGLITAIIATVVTLFVAEYLCLSFEILEVFKDEGINFYDAIKLTPIMVISDPEVLGVVIKELVMSYILGGIACVSEIVNIVKARKKR